MSNRKDSNFLRSVVLAAILGPFLVTQSGCLLIAAAAATGGTVAYVKGDSEVLMEATPPQVAAAAEKSAKELGLIVVTNEATSVDSKVVTRTASDARVVVYAKAEGDKLSKVHVRMGVFGDDAMQARMLEKIKANLPEAVAAHPTPAPATQPASASADAKN